MSVAAKQIRQDPIATAENDWTIMVFFAGDADLSPSMTSQLKSIKDAGFQKNTTVLVHYDPNERGVATRTFDINRKRKAEKDTVIGDGKDPFVRNLIEDSIPGTSNTSTAIDALTKFLDIGLRDRPAKHYMVFLIGHGMIVGNDAFLPDRRPDSAITLQQLGDTLSDFQRGVKIRGGEVELIGLHSCSMSAIEVTYQLKGAAKFLMATEGVAFVSSWPYRQLLKKILNSIDVAKEADLEVDADKLVMSIQSLSLHNSTDFMFSGLSADLTLCRLDPDRIAELTIPLQNLTKALKKGLNDPRGLELIQLSHLKSQSYWQETYSDLYDFCMCLERECKAGDQIQYEMAAACGAVRAKLEESQRGLIVRSDYFGPLYQYSHGLSIYFPWSRPSEDILPTKEVDILMRYKDYSFTTALGADSWLSFLEDYFNKTRRRSREAEDMPASSRVSENGSKTGANADSSTVGTANLSVADALDDPRKPSPPLGKPSPPLTEGTGCSCSIKNFPMQFTQSVRAAEDPNKETAGAAWPETARETVPPR